MIYLQLFYTFFVIGMFTFGGGWAMLSLIQNEVVVKHAWLTATQFADIVAVAQMTPGPIGINSATYVGYTVSGSIAGSVISTIAVTLPSFIILLIICKLYDKYSRNKIFENIMKAVRPVVIGMIASAAAILITPENFFDWTSWLLFAAAFAAGKWLKVNPILLIIAGGVIGYLIY
jgi:chromate transporter